MNVNSIIQAHASLKSLLYILSLTILTGVFLGYTIAPKQQPKELFCKKEIAQVEILNTQILELRKVSVDDKLRVRTECEHEQKLACAKKIERYRSACLELKCQICKGDTK